MSTALKDRTAIITGGASGIGLAIARSLVERSARALLLDVDDAAGTAAAADLGPRAEFIHLDVSDPAAWDRLEHDLLARFGGIDIAVLNAGRGSRVSEPDGIATEQYRSIIGTNIDGVFYGARLAVRQMRPKRRGAIVVTSSLAGLIALPRDPLYAMSKHAVNGFIRALGPQLADTGITVNAVCPGLTDTPIISPRRREKLAAAGFPLIPVTDIADAMLECIEGSETGRVIVCQPGREPIPYRYPRVPGPRVAGQSGPLVPPAAFAGSDQL